MIQCNLFSYFFIGSVFFLDFNTHEKFTFYLTNGYIMEGCQLLSIKGRFI